MVDITGKWALVTGASRGVGLRVARALAEKQVKLIVHSRNLKNTQFLVKELQAQGVEVYAVAAELSDEKSVNKLIKEVRKICADHLDILYNNAAIMTTYRPTFEPTVVEYQKSFMVNSITPAKLCDAFLPKMLERNWGRIVNVTSGIIDEPQLMAYSCSKAALDRYVRDMMSTLKGTNVLMNLMDPGWLTTDLGGENAPNHPDTVLPGALVPVLLEQYHGSGGLYEAQNYRDII